MKQQDTSIVIRLKEEFMNGNGDAFASMYKLYVKDLYAYGLSINSNIDMIEDAIHDVFVDIFTHRENLEHVRNLKHYMMSALRHRLFFLLKKNKLNREITKEEIDGLIENDFQESWIAREEETERSLLVQRLLAHLNPHQREAIHLRFIEGLSYDEISEMMLINRQSVKNLLHRAIDKLRLEFAH